MSIWTAIALLKYEINSTGAVKNAVAKFSSHFLASRKLTIRVNNVSVISTKEYLGMSSMADSWMDREQRYFVSSCLTAIRRAPVCRDRWRPVNGKTDRVQLDISASSVVEKYYETCFQS